VKRRLQPTIVLYGIFLLCVFLLAITKTEAFDTWLHLTFGRLIWDLRGLPVTEPFVLSMAGKPFSYSSWLFGVILYGSYRFLGIYGIVLLKALSATALFLILLRDSSSRNRQNYLAITILIVIAVFIRPRFVERPETFFMVFMAFNIFSLNAFLNDNRKYLFCLPVVNCLWANSHSSISTMVVPFLAVLVGGGLHRYLAKRGVERSPHPTGKQLKTIGAVFIASLGAALISPYGINQFTFAMQFLHTDVFKQEIVELLPPTWNGCPWYFLLAGVTILSFILALRKFSFIDLFFVLPFLYLSTTAVRFIYIFAIVAAPVLARNLNLFLETLPCNRSEPTSEQLQKSHTAPTMAVMAWIVLCTSVGIAGKVPLQPIPVQSGVGFDLSQQPEGALSYMDRTGIQGPLFSSFGWGQYIEWRDFPKRLPLIDGRGYLPDELRESLTMPQNPEKLHDKYGIETILIYYAPASIEAMKFDYDRDILRDPRWALVYFDNLSLLYVRRGGKYDPVIARDEYHFIKPLNNIKGIDPQLQDVDRRRQIVEELKRNIHETDSALGHIFLAHVYNRIGLYEDALGQLSGLKDKVPENLRYLPYEEEGYAYRNLKDTKRSLVAYEESLRRKETPTLHVRIAEDLLDLGRDRDAVKHLLKAIRMDSKVIDAYAVLVSAYKRTGQPEEAAKISKEYAAALRAKEAEMHFQAGVKAYADSRLPDALREFQLAAALDPENSKTYTNIGFIFFDTGQYDASFSYMQKALTLAPKNPLAHYGLAMIYTRLGKKDLARTHWEKYLTIEPRGYYSRLAKQELDSLRR
jgi:tetratricopeptide (TPR) repeat protein